MVEKFLKILQVVVQEPGQVFKPFLPSVISLCMEQVYPIIAEVGLLSHQVNAEGGSEGLAGAVGAKKGFAFQELYVSVQCGESWGVWKQSGWRILSGIAKDARSTDMEQEVKEKWIMCS